MKNYTKRELELLEAAIRKIIDNLDNYTDSNSSTIHEKIEQIKNGQNLDKYVSDTNWAVRLEVARQGYGFEALYNDPCFAIRETVANLASDDILMHMTDDPSWKVRDTIAQRASENILIIMVNDPSWKVRDTIAQRGMFLNILKHDPSEIVRKHAREYSVNETKNTEYITREELLDIIDKINQ